MKNDNQFFTGKDLSSSIEWIGEQIPGGFFIYRADESTEILYANGAVFKIFGCADLDEFKELTGFTFRGMVHPDDYEEVDRSITNQISSESSENRDYVTYRIIRRDGSIRRVEDYGHFAGFPGYGEVFYVFIGDITENYLAQQEDYRRSNVYTATMERYASAADNSLSACIINLSSGVIEEVKGIDLYSSDRVGADKDGFYNSRLNSFLVEGEREQYENSFRLEELMSRFYKGEPLADMVAYCRRESGKQCFVRYSMAVAHNPENGDLMLFAFENEYNNEKASEVLNEKVLVQQYDMVAYIVDNNYSVVIGDAEKIGKGSIFPKSRNGVYTDYIRDYVLESAYTEAHDIDELKSALSVDEIEKNLEKNESYTVNVVCRIDGDIYYKRFTYYAVDKDTKFYLLLKSDVTDVLRHEHEQNEILADALKSAEQANAAKTSFLSNMSHEIRTPMNAIIGLNSIALRDKDLSQQTRDYLIKIGESAGHLLNLINDILDMSRIESGRMTLRKEEFLFGSVIEQIKIMTQSQCRDKGLEFEFINSCDPEEWYFGDDTKLKQIIINILSNAIKFTDPPGKVTFMVEKVAYFDSQSTIRFTIKDTGIGMDESFLPNIFDAFTQEDSSRSNRYGSTGLGMAITKNIVEMMNGSITVDSKKGVGSTFKVTVTLKDCDRPGNKKEFDPNLVKALVIDDDEIALKNTSLVLENIGISCDTVASGAEALKAMEINHAKHEPYNLVFVDWKMPDRNGLDITREINKEYRDEAKIIMLTAYSGDDIMEDAIAAGADGFITKSAFSTIAKSEIKKVMLREKNRIKQKTDLCGKHILLAEDMQINAEIITQVLALKGMDVVHTENGREAFETFKNSKPGTFDAVLMDVRMPEMDGLESTVAIRGLDRVDARKIPIIALTANAFDEDVKRSLQVGMNAHLSKPVEPSRLYSTLEELID